MSSTSHSPTSGSDTARPVKSDMSSAPVRATDGNRSHNREQISKRNEQSNWSTESVAGSSVGGDVKQGETVLGGHKAAPLAGLRSEPST